MDSRHKVATAWAAGKAASGSNVMTDGDRVFSYGHPVGHTEATGRKLAYDCHYSVTTTKHCSAFKAVAAAVIDCDHQNGVARA